MKLDRRMMLGGMAASVARVGPATAASPAPVTLEAAPAELKLGGAAATVVWAYNGQVPGPLLRVRKGEEVRVRLVNRLAQPTTLCWHGVRIANAMAGIGGLTQPPVPPGEAFEYRFTPPDSGLYWYHPHAWPHAAEQVGRGLYGALIVDEAQPPPVDEDLLVVLADWALDAAGQIKPFVTGAREAGPLLTVNSAPTPDRRRLRPGTRLRLRLLNACIGRIAVVGLDGMKTTVLAIDGQPSELFEPLRGMLPIGPGSRFEVVADLPASGAASLVLKGDGAPDRPLVVFDTAADAQPGRGTVAKLGENPLLPTRIPLERSLKRDLVLAAADKPNAPFAWTLDGQGANGGTDGVTGKPLFTVRRGSAVTLAFVNKTTDPQQMHVGGHVFRVLHDLDDGWDPYWRDSVLVAPGRTKHVAFIADNPGRWPVESLFLDRQGAGLAGFFTVEPGR